MLSAAPHPGPPIWGNLVILEGEIVLELQGEPEPLQENIGFEHSLMGPLDDAELERARSAFGAYFREHNAVFIDGERVLPTLRRFEVPVDDPEEDGWLTVKADLVYACEGLPRSVSVTWDRFEGTEWGGESYVPILVKHGRDVAMSSMWAEEPQFIWHTLEARPRALARQLPEPAAPVAPALPYASIALILAGGALAWLGWRRKLPRVPAGLGVVATGAAAVLLWDARYVPWRARVAVPSPDQALELFEVLHRNTYAAFDGSTEDEIYDLLAATVDAAILDDLYGDIYESLILREEGGAVCSVDEIEVLSRAADVPRDESGDPRFDVDWSWRVHGLVAHWGHIHRRVNRYRATYGVRHDGRSWKIASVTVHEHAPEEEDG